MNLFFVKYIYMYIDMAISILAVKFDKYYLYGTNSRSRQIEY